MKTETAKINDFGEEKALVVIQFKGKRRNCGKLVIRQHNANQSR
jgi:hypothetical protein